MKFTVLVLLSTLTLAAVVALASDDDEGVSWFSGKNTSSFVQNESYKTECGDCHMAYPAFLLPSDAWAKLMDGLDDHFGDNAELDQDVEAELRDYLMTHAADKTNVRLGKKMLRAGGIDMRISTSRYIKNKHRGELPRDIFTRGDVNSLAQCDACHKNAALGSFRESEIDIPGYGRWDD